MKLRTHFRAFAFARALIAALVVTSLASACSKDAEQPTQIVVVIDSDWAALERVRLQVDGLGDGKPIEISLARNWLPRTVALSHQGGPLGPITVTASGFIAGADTPAIVEPREEVYFERGRVRALRIELLAVCERACKPGKACVAGDDGPSCESPAKLNDLSDWNGPDHVKVLRPDLKGGDRVTADAGTGTGDDASTVGNADASTVGNADASTGGNPDASTVGDTDASTVDASTVIDAGKSATTCAETPDAPCGACGPVKRKLLTVNGADVSKELSEFPLLVSLVDDDLKAALSSGHDLCFTSAQGEPLAFEIERWDQASGGLDAWVRVPTLRADADTTLYLYYGDGRDDDRSDPSGVWDDEYVGVYHTAAATDATGNDNDGEADNVDATAGRIGDALEFDGDDGHVELGQSAFDDLFEGGATVEAWIRPNSFGENDLGRILDKAEGTLPEGGWALFVRDNGVLTDEGLTFGQSFDDSMQVNWTTPDESIKLDTWLHVAVVYDSSSPDNDAVIYFDGLPAEVDRSETGSNDPEDADSDADKPLRIGNHVGEDTRTFDGLIDEVRISKTMRSAAWFATQVENQSSPDTFLLVGAGESIQ